MDYAKHFSTEKTPQSQPIPGSDQVPNSAGGFSWAVNEWMQLDRFLVLGSEGGSYYASERKLTLTNATALEKCVKTDGLEVVRRIVEISDAGRAPKNDQAIFALAYTAKKGDDVTRKAAYEALPKVCRIGTHLFAFAKYIEAFGGWSRGTRRAVAAWYNRDLKDVAYQAIKYQTRDGWANRDLLRLSHPKPASEAHDALFQWMVKGEGPKKEWPLGHPLEIVAAFEELKKCENEPKRAMGLIEKYGLPRECVPTALLNSAAVWDVLLQHMKPEAMIRNLGKMTAVGLLKPLSDASRKVADKLSDAEVLRKARLHPIKVLTALLTYQSGRGVKGSLSWSPDQVVVNALDEAFYKTFANVEPTGKNTLLALDVSGSMSGGVVAGVPGLTPRIASASMALITAAVEKQHAFVGFSHRLIPLSISPRQRLDDVVRTVSNIPFGATNCSLPMAWAFDNKIEVETFVVYTDSETWSGGEHPVQTLREYRKRTGIKAKLIVVGMVANEFTIADPNDAGMLDVIGFDTATPAVMADFARA